MNTLIRTCVLLALMAGTTTLPAQDLAQLARVGWDPLPDSLFLSWNLPQDQVRRLRMIEEDYQTELAKLMADGSLSASAREARLHTLAQARRNEIRGVLPMRQFDAWQEQVRRTQR